MDSEREYQKVSDYDLKGNLDNHRVFVSRLQRTPWKAFGGALVFSVLALVLAAGSDSKKGVILIVGLALATAVWFFSIGILAILKQR